MAKLRGSLASKEEGNVRYVASEATEDDVICGFEVAPMAQKESAMTEPTLSMSTLSTAAISSEESNSGSWSDAPLSPSSEPRGSSSFEGEIGLIMEAAIDSEDEDNTDQNQTRSYQNLEREAEEEEEHHYPFVLPTIEEEVFIGPLTPQQHKRCEASSDQRLVSNLERYLSAARLLGRQKALELESPTTFEIINLI